MKRAIKRLLMRIYVNAVALSCRRKIAGIALSLARVLPPPGRFIRGGKIKLVQLRERFGDRRWKFNLAYLVSSTLPSNPDIWVRALKRAGVRIVWNQNGVAYPAWAGTEERVERINAPIRLLKEADFVVYQSAFCKESADRWVGPTEAPHAIIYNYVDTDLFSPAPESPPSHPVRLLVMGSHMTPEKVLVPLEALRLLRGRGVEATLSIIGPLEWEGAAAQVDGAISHWGLGGSVERFGKYLHEDAPALYRKHHIFMHLKYMDPCPNAVIEAMACGLPVIGSRSGGMPELVSDTAGILLDVPTDWDRLQYPDAEAVAGAVQTIALQWPVWSRQAREQAVLRFGAPQWLDAHERIFNRVLAIS